MLLQYRCVAAGLLHSVSCRVKSKKKSTQRPYKYEDYSISKYLEAAETLGISVTPLGFGMYELKKGNVTRRILANLSLDNENPVSCRLC